MGMEAAIQLSIRLKVEQAGEARGNLLIYTSEMEIHVTHVKILLLIAALFCMLY